MERLLEDIGELYSVDENKVLSHLEINNYNITDCEEVNINSNNVTVNINVFVDDKPYPEYDEVDEWYRSEEERYIKSRDLQRRLYSKYL